jgi:16S rRNA pseudouridine516 synthase
MERLDKIIGRETGYSRKDIKILVKNKRIKVNDEIVLKSDMKVSEKDIIKLDNNIIELNEYIYLVLNKPKGYISATEDESVLTVLDLIDDKYRHRNLFPAGRLDKDTTGLMIITDDGAFAHNILSPKKHVEKIYNVKIDIPITEEMIFGFKNGVELIDGECKSTVLEKTGEYTCKVTLTEGRYHQIKRMFGCFKAKVVELERIKIGNFNLPNDLELGSFRELTEEELKLIKRE